MAYHMTKHSIIDVMLFLLVYDRKVILSIDEIRSLMIYERMMSIVKEIPYIKEKVRLIIQKV